jgi:hypothetical protein
MLVFFYGTRNREQEQLKEQHKFRENKTSHQGNEEAMCRRRDFEKSSVILLDTDKLF